MNFDQCTGGASRGGVSNSQCPGGARRRVLLSKVTVVNSDTGIHPTCGWGVIPVSIANYASGLTVTASAPLIAIAQFGSRGSGPKDTAKPAQTLDHLTDKNQQSRKENQELVGDASFQVRTTVSRTWRSPYQSDSRKDHREICSVAPCMRSEDLR
jgi:hypothetical protein